MLPHSTQTVPKALIRNAIARCEKDDFSYFSAIEHFYQTYGGTRLLDMFQVSEQSYQAWLLASTADKPDLVECG